MRRKPSTAELEAKADTIYPTSVASKPVLIDLSAYRRHRALSTVEGTSYLLGRRFS